MSSLSFVQLLNICKKHVAVKGDYFEGKSFSCDFMCICSYRPSPRTLNTYNQLPTLLHPWGLLICCFLFQHTLFL